MQERSAGAGENRLSKFECVPGRGRFHIHAGRNESHPAVGTTALMDRTPSDHLRTLGARNDGRHGGEGLPKAGVEGRGVRACRFVACDEREG